jgi:hypothetical protein
MEQNFRHDRMTRILMGHGVTENIEEIISYLDIVIDAEIDGAVRRELEKRRKAE